MNDNLIERFIGEVKKELTTISTDAMKFPKSDPFNHGTQVGNYQGLSLALDILEKLLRDNYDKESES